MLGPEAVQEGKRPASNEQMRGAQEDKNHLRTAKSVDLPKQLFSSVSRRHVFYYHHVCLAHLQPKVKYATMLCSLSPMTMTVVGRRQDGEARLSVCLPPVSR